MTATTPAPTATPTEHPGALGSTLRHAAALGWTVTQPAPRMWGLTHPNGANRVAFIADPITGGILRTWVNGRHPLPLPWLPVHAMPAGPTVSLDKVYAPRGQAAYRDR